MTLPDLAPFVGRVGLFVEGGWVVLARVAAAEATRQTVALAFEAPADMVPLACNVQQRPPRFTDRLPFGRAWTARHATDTFAASETSWTAYEYAPFTVVFDPEAVAAFRQHDLAWMDGWF